MENIIIDLYYIKKFKQKDIANKLNISEATVSRIIRKDKRYSLEKEYRKKENKIKHNKSIQKRVVHKRKKNQFKDKNDDLILKKIHMQDACELSKHFHLSNENYRQWNYSAYNYNPSKRRYEFNKKLGRSADVPKYVKERIF